MTALGGLILRECRRRGHTLREGARSVGVWPGLFSALVRGRQKTVEHPDKVRGIAAYLGLTVEDVQAIMHPPVLTEAVELAEYPALTLAGVVVGLPVEVERGCECCDLWDACREAEQGGNYVRCERVILLDVVGDPELQAEEAALEAAGW
jgi:transcriptional regulator with XRE-family HTH domain